MSARFDEEWMPFFGNWFWNSRRVAKLGDSAALLYQWLLWYQWENEHLDEPAVMRQIAPGRFARQWSKLWPKVEHLFSVGEDGRLRNPTCAEQREHAEAIRKRGRERASRGAQATNARRWGDRSSDKQAIAQATPERPSSDRLDVACESLGDRTGPDRTVQDRTGEIPPTPLRGRAAAPPVEIPEALDTPEFRAAWADWQAYRREAKLRTWKPRTVASNLAAWAAWGPDAASEAIRHAIRSGWMSVQEPRGPVPSGGARAPHGSNVFADELARRNGSNSPTIDVPGVRVGGAA